ncbi:MAG TPA: hypothetical protein VIM55_03410 [Mucilaginibacter sp.]
MKTLKKVLLYSLGTLLLLLAVLAAHIYYVYRPKADASTKVMARMDIKQQLTQEDVNKITAWMYHQKGIDHVLVSPESNIVIFTFYPVKTTGDQIVKDFKANFSFPAERFKPTAENLKSSCPVASTSYGYKIYKFIAKTI